MTIAERVLAEARTRLNELALLKRNWDSYGGLAPSKNALGVARGFVEHTIGKWAPVIGETARPYVIVPVAGGGVQIEWRTPVRDIEVELGPDGSFGYLWVVRDSSGQHFDEGDNVTLDKVVDLVGQALQGNIVVFSPRTRA